MDKRKEGANRAMVEMEKQIMSVNRGRIGVQSTRGDGIWTGLHLTLTLTLQHLLLMGKGHKDNNKVVEVVNIGEMTESGREWERENNNARKEHLSGHEVLHGKVNFHPLGLVGGELVHLDFFKEDLISRDGQELAEIICEEAIMFSFPE